MTITPDPLEAKKPRRKRTIRKRTKLQAASETLAEMAHRLGPGAKLPTVHQLCKQLGISVITLNNALNVVESQKLIIRKHGVGIYVAGTLHTRLVRLLCDPSFFSVGSSPFWPMLVEQLRQRARDFDEEISLHLISPQAGIIVESTNDYEVPAPSDLPTSLVTEIRDGRVNGLLGLGLSTPIADWLISKEVPFVAFAGYGRAMVILDNEQMIRDGIATLAEQGCQRIAVWRPAPTYRRLDKPRDLSEQLRTTIRAALDAQNLPFVEELFGDSIFDLSLGDTKFTTVSLQEQGYRRAEHIFGPNTSPESRPDGLLILDDLMTAGVLAALRHTETSIGHGKNDLKIASHANAGSPVLLGWEKDVTFLEFDPAEIVQAMFEQLEAQMVGETPEEPCFYIAPHRKP